MSNSRKNLQPNYFVIFSNFLIIFCSTLKIILISHKDKYKKTCRVEILVDDIMMRWIPNDEF